MGEKMTATSKKCKKKTSESAKSRREKENIHFREMAQQLPLPPSVASQLDKASVARLTSSYIKLRELFPGGLGRDWGEGPATSSMWENSGLKELGKLLNKAFHGFVFILGPDATILYISEEASAQLGYSQVQLTGNSFWEYVHRYDVEEMKSILCLKMTQTPAVNVGSSVLDEIEVARSFAVRLKCILPKRQAELAVDGYKVIHCRGYLKLKRKVVNWDVPSSGYYEVAGLVAAGHSLSTTPSAELKLSRQDFMFRTELSLKFIYIEPGSQAITGYEPMQLKDKSFYTFVHPYDCKQIQEVHVLTVRKSQAISSYYRFLTRCGGWIWIQSSCIVISNSKADRDHCILFINSVLSERQYPKELFDMEQLQMMKSDEKNPTKGSRAGGGRKVPYQVKKASSYNSASFINNSLHQSNRFTSKVQLSNMTSLFGSDIAQDKLSSHSPGFVLPHLQSMLSEFEKVKNSYQRNTDNHFTPQSYGSFNTYSLEDHETNASLACLEHMTNAIGNGTGCSLPKNDASTNAKFDASQELHAVSSVAHSSIAFQNQVIESSHSSSERNSSSCKNEQLCYPKSTTENSLNSGYNEFAIPNPPSYAKENQCVITVDSLATSLNKANNLSQKFVHGCMDAHGNSLNSNGQLPRYNQSVKRNKRKKNKLVLNPYDLVCTKEYKSNELNQCNFVTSTFNDQKYSSMKSLHGWMDAHGITPNSNEQFQRFNQAMKKNTQKGNKLVMNSCDPVSTKENKTDELNRCNFFQNSNFNDQNNASMKSGDSWMGTHDNNYNSNEQFLCFNQAVKGNTEGNDKLVMNLCASISTKENQTNELNQYNFPTSLPFSGSESSMFLACSEQHCLNDAHKVTPYSYGQTLCYNESISVNSLNNIEEHNKFYKNSAVPPTSKEIKTNEFRQSNLATSLPFTDSMNENFMANSSLFTAGYGFFSVPMIPAFNGNTANEEKHINKFDTFHTYSNSSSSNDKMLADRIIDSLFSHPLDKAGKSLNNIPASQALSVNTGKNDHTNRFCVSYDTNNSAMPNANQTTGEISTISSPVTINNDANRFRASYDSNNSAISNISQTPVGISPAIVNDHANRFRASYDSNNGVMSNINQTPAEISPDIVNDHTNRFRAPYDSINSAMSDINQIPIEIPTVPLPFLTDDHSNSICPPYNLNNSVVSNIQPMSRGISTVSHSITTNDHTNKYCASNDLNNSAESITTGREMSTVSPVTENEYLVLSNGHKRATYREPTPNPRSESASSTSLGYMSGSSRLEQSSPFSGYNELDSFFNRSLDESLMPGSSDSFSF